MATNNKANLPETLFTPDESPWSARDYAETTGDRRSSYQRDRDRVLHCESFRKLQHKTQVFVVHEGDFFRTRLTHTLEVAQIGRGLSKELKLTEDLVEAICLAHDLGHAPFGHSGEHILNKLLNEGFLNSIKRRTWNSNEFSLKIVEDLELQYFRQRGLNLTWATKEGLARHQTQYDIPSKSKKYRKYKQPSLESQVASVADIIAYCTLDVEDALSAGIIEPEKLKKIDFLNISMETAQDELNNVPNSNPLSPDEQQKLLYKRIHRHSIDFLIRDVLDESSRNIITTGVLTPDEARSHKQRLVRFSSKVERQVKKLLDFMLEEFYRGPQVARQNYRAEYILKNLFKALTENQRLLPNRVQEDIEESGDKQIEVARYLASLTDRSATDLYAELFEPLERAMGHHLD